jgi:hypothetical protein
MSASSPPFDGPVAGAAESSNRRAQPGIAHAGCALRRIEPARIGRVRTKPDPIRSAAQWISLQVLLV